VGQLMFKIKYNIKGVKQINP